MLKMILKTILGIKKKNIETLNTCLSLILNIEKSYKSFCKDHVYGKSTQRNL